jgi:hypothetical protein
MNYPRRADLLPNPSPAKTDRPKRLEAAAAELDALLRFILDQERRPPPPLVLHLLDLRDLWAEAPGLDCLGVLLGVPRRSLRFGFAILAALGENRRIGVQGTPYPTVAGPQAGCRLTAALLLGSKTHGR